MTFDAVLFEQGADFARKVGRRRKGDLREKKSGHQHRAIAYKSRVFGHRPFHQIMLGKTMVRRALLRPNSQAILTCRAADKSTSCWLALSHLRILILTMIAPRQSSGSGLRASGSRSFHSRALLWLRCLPGCLLLQLLPLHAEELDSPKSNAASSGQDPATAMRLFHAAPGFKIDLFAAEP